MLVLFFVGLILPGDNSDNYTDDDENVKTLDDSDVQECQGQVQWAVV